IITTRDEQKSKALIQNYLDSSFHEELPKYLTLHSSQYKGLVNQIIDSTWVGLKINEYSKFTDGGFKPVVENSKL
ncbi:hypothetical protein MKW92_001981, partial [Papaver armeniacum]